MKRYFTVLAVLALSACGDSDSEATSITSADGTTEYEVSGAGDDTRVRMSDAEGNEAVFTGGSDAAGELDLPDGYALYPGAEVESSTTFNGSQGSGVMVTFAADASSQELAEYYRKQATSAGVVIDTDARTGEERMIAGEGPGGLSFSLQSSADGSGSTGILVISQ